MLTLWLISPWFVSPMKQVAYQTCDRTTSSRSLLEMCFCTYFVLGIGWADSWCIAKHASGLQSENIFTGFWMRLLSWITGSLLVTTPLHCNSCFWHQGNGSILTAWKRKPLQPIPYWFNELTRFYKWNQYPLQCNFLIKQKTKYFSKPLLYRILYKQAKAHLLNFLIQETSVVS